MTDRKDALITLLDHVVGAGFAPSQAQWCNAFDSVIEGRPSKHHYPILKDQARLAFMGSLDAAKALHEAVLPDHSFLVGINWAEVWIPFGSELHLFNVGHDNPARAWLIAILKALIAQDTTQDGEP
jgi:hypothetical protein